MIVFAVVVTYNGMQWYDRCFGSLCSSEIPVEIVVVDNASSDDTSVFIKKNFSHIHLIESNENLGFGRANNLGIRFALDHGADFVLLLNQDAWIEPNTIEGLMAIAHAHPEFGILSPIHMNVDKSRIEHLLLRRLDDCRTTDPALFDDLFFGRVSDVYETKYVNAASWFLSRKTLETIGGFDPIFFHYGEDDNYLHRTRYHGLKVGVCPQIRVVHDNDRPRPLYDSREHEVLMLIEYTNVNKTHNISRDMRQHWFKAFKGFLKGRRKAAKDHFSDYCWLKQHRKAIEASVSANRKVGLNWL